MPEALEVSAMAHRVEMSARAHHCARDKSRMQGHSCTLLCSAELHF
jgi:hypothetical protein